MAILGSSRRRAVVALASAAAIAVGGVAVAGAIGTHAAPPPSNARNSMGHGVDQFGMTAAYYRGKTLKFTYTKGFFCDTRVHSFASSKCEVGANYKRTPAKRFDPLYITVPLGFSEKMRMLDCPDALVCVDHPGTIDLTRLEPALKPLYPTLTNKQLYAALKNFPTPGHNHFVTTTDKGKRIWWDVKVIGVTDQKLYNKINQHKSYGFIAHLLKNKNKSVVGPIDTNLFLYFSVGKRMQ